MNIKYIQKDLFSDLANIKNQVYIPHVTNNIGIIGGGFTGPLIKRWPEVANSFYNHYDNSNVRGHIKDFLGTNQYIVVESEFMVINMYAQNGVVSYNNPRPLIYSALASCMEDIARRLPRNSKIICPQFGAGLAKGSWKIIEGLIEEIWCKAGLEVTVYIL